MRLICFEVKEWQKYLEVLKHQERLNHIKKDTNDDFRGRKILSKVKLLYLEVKLKEPTFDRWV